MKPSKKELKLGNELIVKSNSVNLNLTEIEGSIGSWARKAIKFGFGDYDENEVEFIAKLVKDIEENSEIIEYILSNK